jgi:molybdenum cofactor cytidylyltransferase
MQTQRQRALGYGVIILAAGASSRMGKPKLVLPWGGGSILEHLVRQWRDLQAEQIGVVYFPEDSAMRAELDRLAFPEPDRIPNVRPARGMFSSIQCAARWPGWQTGLTHWVIVLGDQPQVKRQTLEGLLNFAAAHWEHICQPSRHGRARHPVVLPRWAFALVKESGAENLKQFRLELAEKLSLMEAADAGLDYDIDTPEDYQKAVELFC